MQARLIDVSKRYGTIQALREVHMEVPPGKWVALMGPSGCGKSTLLHLLAGIDRPDAGEVWVGDEPVHRLPDRQLTELRRDKIGYVFQFFHLLPTLTAADNVALPLLLKGAPAGEASARAAAVLDELGVADQRDKFPHAMSGGQTQRVAIARAVIHRPLLLVADEPTGNLDSASGEAVLTLLRRLVEAWKLTLVMATHSQEAAERADGVFKMRDGCLV